VAYLVAAAVATTAVAKTASRTLFQGKALDMLFFTDSALQHICFLCQNDTKKIFLLENIHTKK
jgi:hypothetical protein